MKKTGQPLRVKPVAFAVAVAFAPFGIHPAMAGSASGETELSTVTVNGAQSSGGLPPNLAANSAGYSAKELYEQVNVINTEDIVKYSPDTMTRKRYIGDRNAIIETRTAGVTASARSLVYADGVLLSNLLGNSYSYPPRWSMVSPEEIQRVDFFFGPHSAEYAGNSIGTTVLMTTRMPEKLEGHLKTQMYSENSGAYGHDDRYNGSNTNLLIGGKAGAISWLVGYDHLHANGHPMQFAQLPTSTSSGTATAVSGAVSDTGPDGKARTFVGGQSLDETTQDSLKIKLGAELAPGLKLRYTLGNWQNTTYNKARSWLTDASGNTITSGLITLNGSTKYSLGNLFSENTWDQEHWMHALSLKSTQDPGFSWEAVASVYDITKDTQHVSSPGGVSGAGVGAARTTYYGQLTRNPYGDGWQVLDLRGRWAPGGTFGQGSHELSFGYHFDRYTLDTTSYYTTTLNDGSWKSSNATTQLSNASKGETRTQAIYLQDLWRFAPENRLTVGGRVEDWQAQDGYNAKLTTSGSTTALVSTHYPNQSKTLFSPKLAYERDLNADWLMRAAMSKAYRFPTVTELYQALTSGNSIITGNPDLKPEQAVTTELTLERDLGNGLLRATLFHEDMHDALLSQTAVVSGVTTTAIQNVDHVQVKGLTLAYQQTDVGLRGLDLTGSVTYANARTLKNSANPAYEGKVYPGVPDWRGTLVATWHASDRLTWSVGARYSGYQAYTADNSDVNQNLYGANSRFFVMDTRITYKLDEHTKAALGIDNLNDERYYAYHPMPRRTLHAELKYDF
ncbi:MAG: TonB-dependent receptor [Zoogloea sp.]|uniref:TonB-dependent receptor n=1 Tax=Zoogloea sp. TaxID=49181 RepID=UPI003F3F3DC6